MTPGEFSASKGEGNGHAPRCKLLELLIPKDTYPWIIFPDLYILNLSAGYPYPWQSEKYFCLVLTRHGEIQDIALETVAHVLGFTLGSDWCVLSIPLPCYWSENARCISGMVMHWESFIIYMKFSDTNILYVEQSTGLVIWDFYFKTYLYLTVRRWKFKQNQNF